MSSKIASRLGNIIREFYKGGLSPALEDAIKGMLVKNEHKKEQNEVLEDLFDQNVKPSLVADKNTLDSLDDMHRRLDFAPHPTRMMRMRRATMKVAAALIPVAVVAGVLFTGNQDGTEKIPTMAKVSVEVPAADQKTISLPDGSVVKLAERTVFTYNEDFLTGRNVYLEGEAYFKVSKMDGQPFTVTSPSMTLTVLGTEFSLKDYAGDQTAQVKLTTGSVSVIAQGIGETTLTPGQHITYDKIQKTTGIDQIGQGELLRLRGINLSFSGQSVDEAFRMMSQFFQVTIMVSEELDLHERIELATEDDATLDDVMQLIQLIINTDFEYTIQGDTVKVTPRR